LTRRKITHLEIANQINEAFLESMLEYENINANETYENDGLSFDKPLVLFIPICINRKPLEVVHHAKILGI
jgi:hypothetical protein